VYVFAYYEWTIIWIIELLQPGFVGRYSRGTPMVSAKVKDELQRMINNQDTNFTLVTSAELQDCCSEFERLIIKRNALIHAHPITDTDGSQILAYQTKTTKHLPDMKWPITEVEIIIREIDSAACRAGAHLDKLRK
jgi:hypothetical protein